MCSTGSTSSLAGTSRSKGRTFAAVKCRCCYHHWHPPTACSSVTAAPAWQPSEHCPVELPSPNCSPVSFVTGTTAGLFAVQHHEGSRVHSAWHSPPGRLPWPRTLLPFANSDFGQGMWGRGSIVAVALVPDSPLCPPPPSTAAALAPGPQSSCPRQLPRHGEHHSS